MGGRQEEVGGKLEGRREDREEGRERQGEMRTICNKIGGHNSDKLS